MFQLIPPVHQDYFRALQVDGGDDNDSDGIGPLEDYLPDQY